ncbi:MAG: MFS transporter [Deltaproteobacteria bacterium]|nr:MFS transporter [Deltaproteobacteria bacterium]
MKRRVFVVLFFSIFASMLGNGIIVPLLPIYAEGLGASGFWIGVIFSGFAISRSIFMPIVGRWSDKRGRKVFIATGLFIYAIISLGYILSDSVADLVTVRAIQGFSAAMIIPIAFAYIGEISPKDKEGSYLGLFSISLFAGFGLGPLLGGILHDQFGLDADFYAMGGLCWLAFFLVLLLLPELHLYRKFEHPRSYIEIIRSPVTKGLLFFRFSTAFTRGLLITFLPLFAHSSLGLTSSQTGIILSSNILLTSLLQAPFGHMADRFTRRGLVFWGSFWFSLGVALIPHMRSLAQIFVLNILLGAVGALPFPAANALVVEEGRKYGMGALMAIFNLSMSLGFAAGPILGGIISDLGRQALIFYVGGLVGAVGALAFAAVLGGK